MNFPFESDSQKMCSLKVTKFIWPFLHDLVRYRGHFHFIKQSVQIYSKHQDRGHFLEPTSYGAYKCEGHRVSVIQGFSELRVLIEFMVI